jgi:hypothetical protein
MNKLIKSYHRYSDYACWELDEDIIRCYIYDYLITFHRANSKSLIDICLCNVKILEQGI